MTVETRPRLPGAPDVMARAGGENFTVASRVLPRAVRADLLALYGYARLVDETGDAVAGDRLAALDWLEADLDRAYAGRAEHPVLQRLTPVLRDRRLPREPLAALIEANRRDQRVSRYETFEDLLGYCELSANPVGRLVLCVLDAATPERVALSDAVCTGLQLAEHWQDLAEDLAAGRLYVPLEDLRRFGCAERDLAAAPAPRQVRELMAFEVSRARELLDRGAPLARTLHGRARWAVAGFVAGGRAALDAIAGAEYDVLGGAPRAGAGRRALALLRAIAETRR
jgi:squalene synthase HpnC